MSAELRLVDAPGAQEAAGAVVRAVANTAGVTPERTTRLRVVIEELVREAVERPRAGTQNEIVVRAEFDSGQLRVEVADLSAPVSGSDSRHSPSRRLAALGFVDELHIGSHGSSGNVATCGLRLEPLESDLGGEQVLTPDAPAAADEDVAALQLRVMEPGDAMELVRCIYRCYGYSYKDSLLYEPRHVAKELRSGRMHSVVLSTPEKAIVGHCALFVERRGDAVPEAGKMVVDPRYRGHHLAEKLATHRLELARELELPGFWAEAVTNHPASQFEVIRLGGSEVGLLIGASPADVAMVGITNQNEGRRSLLVTYSPLRPQSRAISVPERHSALISELAERLGLERELESSNAEPEGRTAISTTVIPSSGSAHMRVERVGEDLRDRVADELEGLDSFDLGAVHLDLPLDEPASAGTVEMLERLDFSFAAWIPDYGSGTDVLRLQRVGSHPVDTEHVVCARSEGEAVRDYVVAEWHRVRRGADG